MKIKIQEDRRKKKKTRALIQFKIRKETGKKEEKKKANKLKKCETMKINGKTPSGLLKNFSQESYVGEWRKK